MKLKNIFVLLFIAMPFVAFLQPSTDTAAPYFKNIGLPNLKLQLVDSTTIYTNKNLPTNKIIAVIFFSPDCDHCQKETSLLMDKKDSLNNLFMVWNANMVDEFSKVKEFYNQYKLNTLTNSVVGKEVDYYLPLHYRIEHTPFIALFKDGKLFAEFRGTFNVDALIAINNGTYKPIVDYSLYKPVIQSPTNDKKKKKKKKNK